MADRLSRIARRLRPHIEQVGQGLRQQVGPATRLARLDTAVLRAWLSRVGPVQDTLGAAVGQGYTALVIRAAERDAEIARIVAYTLPDQLARVAPAQRARYLSLLQAALRERVEALPLVVRTLPELMERFSDPDLVRYLSQGIALHGGSSRKAESFLKMESGESQRVASALARGVALADVRRVLALYARAHCGEDVQIRAGGDQAFTDGRHLYLPERVERFGDERDFLVYRVLTARNAGYIEFGSLDLDLDALPGGWPAPRPGELAIERLVRGFPNSSLARDLLSLLENTRIEAQVRAGYPGIARDMDALGEAWRPPAPDLAGLAPAEQAVAWLQRAAAGLRPPDVPGDVGRAAAAAAGALPLVRAVGATVADTAAALQRAYPPIDALLRRVKDEDLTPPEPETGSNPAPDRGEEEPEAPPEVERPQPRGGGAEGPDLQRYRPLTPDPLAGELRSERLSPQERAEEEQAQRLLRALRESAPDATLADARGKLRREGASYEEMADLLDRMPGPAGPLRDDGARDESFAARDRDPAQPLAEGTANARFYYPEWDADIEDHKPRWVGLSEYALPPGDPAFVARVRAEHGPAVGQLRRAFEALRPDGLRRVRGETDGEEIDIDRAVTARIERRCGGSPTDRLYTRRLRQERDVSVAFLLDMSSSTNEIANPDGKRILDVEKEALVLISEAVDAIGDSLAIYGFSGYGREQVAFYIAKDFADRFDDRVAERIGRISWKMENRDGAAIRHATRKLADQPSKIKLLLLLSDGKPLDCGCDTYADRYAQEDTRAALTEARRAGIHPFCITVDPHGQEYLARMYGEHSYTVIDRVEALPMRLPGIYRRLTR